MIVGTLAAYAIARMTFAGRKWVARGVVVTYLVPASILFIPMFQVIYSLGLIDNYASLILPIVVNAFNLVVLRQFFMGIPSELLDSAKIDGANDWDILTKIVLPLSLPALLTLVVVNALYVWNDLIIAIIFLQDDAKRTLMAGIISRVAFAVTPNSGRSLSPCPALSKNRIVRTLSPQVVFDCQPRRLCDPLLLTARGRARSRRTADLASRESVTEMDVTP